MSRTRLPLMLLSLLLLLYLKKQRLLLQGMAGRRLSGHGSFEDGSVHRVSSSVSVFSFGGPQLRKPSYSSSFDATGAAAASPAAAAVDAPSAGSPSVAAPTPSVSCLCS
ncbi:hypothetical protein Emag_000059 [Eimeria magna]